MFRLGIIERRNMSDVLTDTELDDLALIGNVIKVSLECDINGTGVPCRTDRFTAVEAMVRYLEIHDYVCVYDPDNFK